MDFLRRHIPAWLLRPRRALESEAPSAPAETSATRSGTDIDDQRNTDQEVPNQDEQTDNTEIAEQPRPAVEKRLLTSNEYVKHLADAVSNDATRRELEEALQTGKNQLSYSQGRLDAYQSEYEDLDAKQTDAIQPYLQELLQWIGHHENTIQDETASLKELQSSMDHCVRTHCRLLDRIAENTPHLVNTSRVSGRIGTIQASEDSCRSLMELYRSRRQLRKYQIETRELRTRFLAAKDEPQSAFEELRRAWRDSEETLAVRRQNQLEAERELLVNTIKSMLTIDKAAVPSWLGKSASSVSSGQDLSLISARGASAYDATARVPPEIAWRTGKSKQWRNVHEARKNLNKLLRGHAGVVHNYPTKLARYLSTYNLSTKSEFDRQYEQKNGRAFEAREAFLREEIEIWRAAYEKSKRRCKAVGCSDVPLSQTDIATRSDDGSDTSIGRAVQVERRRRMTQKVKFIRRWTREVARGRSKEFPREAMVPSVGSPTRHGFSTLVTPSIQEQNQFEKWTRREQQTKLVMREAALKIKYFKLWRMICTKGHKYHDFLALEEPLAAYDPWRT